MTDELIERLRTAVDQAGSMHGWARCCRDAADEIGRLRAENAVLRAWQDEACDWIKGSRLALLDDVRDDLLRRAGSTT